MSAFSSNGLSCICIDFCIWILFIVILNLSIYRKGKLLISRSLTEPVVGRLRPRLHLFSINTGLIQCSMARCAWQNHPFNFFFFVFVSKNSALTIYSKLNDKIEWSVHFIRHILNGSNLTTDQLILHDYCAVVSTEVNWYLAIFFLLINPDQANVLYVLGPCAYRN